MSRCPRSATIGVVTLMLRNVVSSWGAEPPKRRPGDNDRTTFPHKHRLMHFTDVRKIRVNQCKSQKGLLRLCKTISRRFCNSCSFAKCCNFYHFKTITPKTHKALLLHSKMDHFGLQQSYRNVAKHWRDRYFSLYSSNFQSPAGSQRSVQLMSSSFSSSSSPPKGGPL